jgi:FMN reductase
MQVTILVGNPKQASRTLDVARAIVGAAFDEKATDVEVIELTDYGPELLLWPSTQVDELVAKVTATDLLVVASPTYKATYTGLLKIFLDRYQTDGLSGVVAIAVMTGADKTHALGVDSTLVPLLAGLGAIVIGRGSYFVTSDMTLLPEFAEREGTRYRAAVTAVAGLASAVRSPSEDLADASRT